MAYIMHMGQSLHNLRLSSMYLLSSLTESSKNYSSVVSEVSYSLIVANTHAYSQISVFKLLCQILQENHLLLFST